MTPAATSVKHHASSFSDQLRQHIQVVESLESDLEMLERVADRIYRALTGGNKVLWCGNGGSAADAQHFAAELVGRYRRERRGLPSIALTTDTSALTSISNDYGFAQVFSRQIEALSNPGDVVIAISTSGNSPNICAAIIRARELGCFTFAMTGLSGGAAAEQADMCLRVQSQDTARIQEVHVLAGHLLCDWIERKACEHLEQERNPI